MGACSFSAMITDTRKLWKRFENIFVSMDQMFKYQPAFCNYHKRLLEELCEDNIIYAEIRASLSPVRNLDYGILFVKNLRTFFLIYSFMEIIIVHTTLWKWPQNWRKSLKVSK